MDCKLSAKYLKMLKPHLEEHNVKFLTRFGSHLYGTDTEKSDLDFKGIFIPSFEDTMLNKIKKSFTFTSGKKDDKNTANDYDIELYSLQYFIDLACKGETVALDMLHANSENIIIGTNTWLAIQDRRKKFYTKNLKAFVGYARRQAAKYGVKGSRLSDTKRVSDFLLNMLRARGECRLADVWEALPEGEHIHKDMNPNGLRLYIVCGKKLQETCKLSYAHDTILVPFIKSYGARARQAEANEGIDWKAVSHAFRAGYQVRHILIRGDLKFPLVEANYLKQIKSGELHFRDEVGPVLDTLMDELESLVNISTLPDKSDRKYWDAYVLNIMATEIRR